MSNARIILQTLGEQNVYLNKNPSHTHLKKNTKKYSKFGIDWIVINSNTKNQADYGRPNSAYYFRIEKDGDLINNLYLRLKLKKNPEWSHNNFDVYETIFKIIKRIDFQYNDRVLSSLESDYIFSYFELYATKSEKKKLCNMVSYEASKESSLEESVYLYLPIPLWFHKNPGAAFPLWALNNPNLGINIKTSNYTHVDNRIIEDIELLIDFGYINQDEKEQFINKPLEYLIEMPEIIHSSVISGSALKQRVNLIKSHYIRNLIWNIKESEFNYKYLDHVNSGSITFNGNPLISDAPGNFFNDVSRYTYFNDAGTIYMGNNNGKYDDSTLNDVYSYSFCLNPIDPKSSGYLTSEKFNNVTLELDINSDPNNNQRILNIYQIKHNLLRINNGTLSLLFN